MDDYYDRPDPIRKMLTRERITRVTAPPVIVEERRVTELETLKLERDDQRVADTWIVVKPVTPPALPVDVDAAERLARERQAELLQKQVTAEQITRVTAPPRIVQRRRAKELAVIKEEKFELLAREKAALIEQGFTEAEIGEVQYGVDVPGFDPFVDLIPEPVVIPPVTTGPVVVAPVVEGLDPRVDGAVRKLLFLAVAASIVKALARD